MTLADLTSGGAQAFRRNAGVESAPLPEECILFDPGTNRYCLLNRTAAVVWAGLARPATAEELAGGLCRSFSGVSAAKAREDVDRVLAEMLALAVVSAVPAESAAGGDS